MLTIQTQHATLRGVRLMNMGGRPVIVPVKGESKSAGARERQRGYTMKVGLAFLAIYVIWGSTYLAIRYAIETIPPLVTAGMRHAIAGSIMLAWAWTRGFRPTRDNWIAGAMVGACFFLFGHGALHWAEQYVQSGLAALLTATEPMFILVLGWTMGQQRISVMSGLGLLLGAGGVALLTGAEASAKSSSMLGMAAVLFGAFAWSMGVVISPRVKLPSDALGRTALPTLCGAAMLLIVAAVSGEFSTTHWSAITMRSWMGLAYLIVFGSVVAFTAYTWLLQRCSPTLVATHTYANPAVAVILGWLIASEPVTMRVALASAAILAAIVLIRHGERVSARDSPRVDCRLVADKELEAAAKSS